MKQIKLAKHSALIQMSQTMTGEQRKIYNYLIFEAKEQMREDSKRMVFEAELWKIHKYTGAYGNHHIKQSVKEMESITVKVNTLGKDKKKKWEPFALLEAVEAYEEEDGFVKFRIPNEIRESIMNPKMYVELDLAIIKNLKSKYAVALYELITDYMKITTLEVKLEEFKTFMGIDPNTKYQRFFDFNKRVVKPAIEEINTKTPISLKVEPIHRGRKVVKLKFFFRYRDESKSEKEKLSKQEEFTRYRNEIYAISGGRSVFVYNNRNIVVDKHPTKHKIMVGYQDGDGLEWFSNEEALIIWSVLKQNRAGVEKTLYEYQCEEIGIL